MCGEFGEVTVIIGLVINFLAFVSPLCAFRDTSTYIFHCYQYQDGAKSSLGECDRRLITTAGVLSVQLQVVFTTRRKVRND